MTQHQTPPQLTQDLRQGLAEARRPGRPTRPVDTFDIPLTLEGDKRTMSLGGGAEPFKVRRLAFHTLTAAEEKAAIKRCGGDGTQIAYQLAIASLAGLWLDEEVPGLPTIPAPDDLAELDADQVAELEQAVAAAVDGAPMRPLSLHDGSADAAWLQFHPALRNLCVQAYAECQTAPEDAQRSFLKSRRRR